MLFTMLAFVRLKRTTQALLGLVSGGYFFPSQVDCTKESVRKVVTAVHKNSR